MDEDRKVVGTLSISDLMGAYRRELLSSVREVTDLAVGAGVFEVRLTAASPATGRKLRAAGLPKGVIVTSISREGEVVLPSGDTMLAIGDRLSVLGGREGLEAVGDVVPLSSAKS